jgi:hypothetical protein
VQSEWNRESLSGEAMARMDYLSAKRIRVVLWITERLPSYSPLVSGWPISSRLRACRWGFRFNPRPDK